MQLAIKIITLITSIVIILSVSLQESKSDGISGVIGGGAEQLFGKKKSRGYNAILERITLLSVIVFFLISLIALFL